MIRCASNNSAFTSVNRKRRSAGRSWISRRSLGGSRFCKVTTFSTSEYPSTCTWEEKRWKNSSIRSSFGSKGGGGGIFVRGVGAEVVAVG